MTDVLTVLVSSATIAAAVRAATPLVLAAIGGVFCERGGVIQLGLEGIMLSGAFAGVAGSYVCDQAGMPGWSCALIGVVVAGVVGVLLSCVQAVLVLGLGVQQVVGGIAINIVALGMTALLAEAITGEPGRTDAVPDIGRWDVPGLEDLPYVGEILFQNQPLTYLAFVLVPLAAWVMYRTRFGLRLQAVGDLPEAVESVGLSVRRLQLTGLLTSGLLAGLAGAYLSLGQLNFFNPNMTSGRGYIALAAMIFGNWRPVPVAAAAFLFGYTDAVQIALQNKGYDIPSDFLIAAPYVITLIALAGAVGNTRPPASIGKILGGQTRDP